jgi:DNA-binding NarL/FixJ family response regulator
MSSVTPEKKAIQVALVEDDEEIRANLTHVFRRSPDFRLMGSYPDAESAMVELPHCQVDAVLMDINLPGIDGVECVRRLKPRMPKVQFIMLTIYEDGNRLFKSLMAGANGYLLKRTSSANLLAAVKEAHTGGVPMTPEMARRVAKYFQDLPKPAREVERLTRREMDVLEQLAKGFRYKEIEDNLKISIGTLRSHITNVYEKLHVHSRTEAVVKYLNRQEPTPATNVAGGTIAAGKQ